MLKTLFSLVKSPLLNERGIINIIPWLLGLTTLINIQHRQQAAQVLDEPMVTPEQLQGQVIQGFANRGLNIGPQSPAVVEALRRQSLARRQQRAQSTLAGPSPFDALFGLFTQG